MAPDPAVLFPGVRQSRALPRLTNPFPSWINAHPSPWFPQPGLRVRAQDEELALLERSFPSSVKAQLLWQNELHSPNSSQDSSPLPAQDWDPALGSGWHLLPCCMTGPAMGHNLGSNVGMLSLPMSEHWFVGQEAPSWSSAPLQLHWCHQSASPQHWACKVLFSKERHPLGPLEPQDKHERAEGGAQRQHQK